MAKVPDQFSGLFDISPDVYPGYLQLPQAQEQAPIPYSPEGWQASKLTVPVPGAEAPESPKAAEKGKKAPVTFTPEQALALQKLTSVPQQPVPHGGGGGGAAPRGQVAPMAQLSTGAQASAPRASLGQIIYGGRKF